MLNAAERAPIDFLLARLLLAELDDQLVESLRRPEILDVLARVDPDVRSEIESPWTTEREQNARDEFARLFLSPGGVPPFAGVWLESEGEQRGDDQLTTFVSRTLDILGRETTTNSPWGNLPLDHLGLLLALAATASSSQDANQREVGDDLRSRALGPWVARFGSSLRAESRMPLYRAAGALLEQLH